MRAAPSLPWTERQSVAASRPLLYDVRQDDIAPVVRQPDGEHRIGAAGAVVVVLVQRAVGVVDHQPGIKVGGAHGHGEYLSCASGVAESVRVRLVTAEQVARVQKAAERTDANGRKLHLLDLSERSSSRF